ncbi:hypothetical protein EDC04DRAFT_2612168 [Pisolithus marmoratus]|nr:hypothetical protein EDC04DRAFT_2612168 [Pisolithus marmoratus]
MSRSRLRKPLSADSHNEPENLPREEEGSLDSSNDCTETKPGYLTLEAEVVDVQGVEDDLQVVVDRATDSEQPEECASMLEAPDVGSQCVNDKVLEGRDLPESRSEALEPADNMSGPASGHSMEDVP